VASYKIQIKRSAQKEIRAVGTKKDRRRIVERIQALASDSRPPGVEKLSGSPFYRVRQGTFRIVYEIKDELLIIHILKVGHRKDVYR